MSLMAEKFDPAPFDRYADSPAAAAAQDRAISEKISAGLEGSFPASDPPSINQPAPSRHDVVSDRGSWWKRIASIFR
jgi:hypothetical protein